MRIVLPIKEEYINKIITKQKRFEYRKILAKKDIDSILLYCTYPVCKIVAEVEVLEKIELPKEKLWNLSKEYSGISKEYYDKYFKNQENGKAYRLGKIKILNKPLSLEEIGINYIVQSFTYIEEENNLDKKFKLFKLF